MTERAVATPRPSSSVILLRPAGETYHILFIRRSTGSSFMAGNDVFPGGCVEPGDRDDQWLGPKGDVTLQPLSDALAEREALPFYASAMRELFEESGVLLACSVDDPAAKIDVRSALDRTPDRDASLARALAGRGCRARLEELRPYVHWITPIARPKRFDTYFFIAMAPPETEASADQQETTSIIWMSPRDALRAQDEGSLNLSPPTVRIVFDLAHRPTLSSLGSALAEPDLSPVFPVLCKATTGPVIVLPDDAQYASARDGLSMEGYRPAAFDDHPTRVASIDGRWRLYVADRPVRP